MEPSDYGDLLRACAFYDNRKVTREAALAWAQAIDKGMTKADALKAIAEHHAESTEYILPAHVNQRVKAIHRERLLNAGTPPIPGDLTWEQERDWRGHWCAAVKAGVDKVFAGEMASRRMNLPPELPASTEESREEAKAKLAALIDAGTKGIPA